MILIVISLDGMSHYLYNEDYKWYSFEDKRGDGATNHPEVKEYKVFAKELEPCYRCKCGGDTPTPNNHTETFGDEPSIVDTEA